MVSWLLVSVVKCLDTFMAATAGLQRHTGSMPQAFPQGPWRSLLAPAAEKGSPSVQVRAARALLDLVQPQNHLWSTSLCIRCTSPSKYLLSPQVL